MSNSGFTGIKHITYKLDKNTVTAGSTGPGFATFISLVACGVTVSRKNCSWNQKDCLSKGSVKEEHHGTNVNVCSKDSQNASRL